MMTRCSVESCCLILCLIMMVLIPGDIFPTVFDDDSHPKVISSLTVHNIQGSNEVIKSKIM